MGASACCTRGLEEVSQPCIGLNLLLEDTLEDRCRLGHTAFANLNGFRRKHDCFYKMGGPFLRCPCSNRPAILASMLRSLIFGNSHNLPGRSCRNPSSWQPAPPALAPTNGTFSPERSLANQKFWMSANDTADSHDIADLVQMLRDPRHILYEHEWHL